MSIFALKSSPLFTAILYEQLRSRNVITFAKIKWIRLCYHCIARNFWQKLNSLSHISCFIYLPHTAINRQVYIWKETIVCMKWRWIDKSMFPWRYRKTYHIPVTSMPALVFWSAEELFQPTTTIANFRHVLRTHSANVTNFILIQFPFRLNLYWWLTELSYWFKVTVCPNFILGMLTTRGEKDHFGRVLS